MWWEEMLKIVGGAAVITAAVAWLVRSIVIHYLSKDIEKYKAELNADLRMIAYEHEVRFSRLHDKRMLYITELYSKVVEAERAARYAFSTYGYSGEPPRIEKIKNAYNQLSFLRDIFDNGRIYLPENLCKQISKFIDSIWDSLIDFESFFEDEPKSEAMQKEKYEVWKNCLKIVKDELPGIRNSLEKEFRQMLGVKQETV